MTDSSTQGIKTVLHPVSDLATAKAVYTALLGVPPQTDGPMPCSLLPTEKFLLANSRFSSTGGTRHDATWDIAAHL